MLEFDFSKPFDSQKDVIQRVLVTGGNGMLGTAVSNCFRLLGHIVLPLGSADANNGDHNDIQTTIPSFKPDLVIHTAAMNDVDACERDPDIANRINAIGAWNIAALCQEAGARMVFISTDFVFDGEKKRPYTEYDRTNPINAYGKSKLVGERLVRGACPLSYVVRTSRLFGAGGECFPKNVLKLAASQSSLNIVSDEIGSPTYVDDLAAAIADIVQFPTFGTYHVANSGECSWYEFAEAILREAGIKSVAVNPISSAEWNSPAMRPAYSALQSELREIQGKPPLRTWKAALSDCLAKDVSLD
jgi:dTDP-4-dehydrorhamnose reductase